MAQPCMLRSISMPSQKLQCTKNSGAPKEYLILRNKLTNNNFVALGRVKYPWRNIPFIPSPKEELKDWTTRGHFEDAIHEGDLVQAVYAPSARASDP